MLFKKEVNMSKSRKAVFDTAGNLFLMLFLEIGLHFITLVMGDVEYYGVVVEIVWLVAHSFF